VERGDLHLVPIEFLFGFCRNARLGGNFAVETSNNIYTFNDATNSFSPNAIAGVSGTVAAPNPPCTSGGCTDANDCTTDLCNLELGCEFVADDAAYDDHDFCTADACDEVDGCSHTPIPDCVAQVPVGSTWVISLLWLGLALASACVFGLRTRSAS